MLRKSKYIDGFFLCFLFNMLFNFWWGAIALVLWIAHIRLALPAYLTLISLFIWISVALVSTWLEVV